MNLLWLAISLLLGLWLGQIALALLSYRVGVQAENAPNDPR